MISSDLYPPTRVDVSVLFAQELCGRGHRIDWILQSEAACAQSYVTPWRHSRVWVGATDLGQSLYHRLHKHLLGFRNDLKMFRLLRGNAYDVIEVKDKFVSGVLAAFAARIYRKRFVYWLSWPFPEEYLIRARDGTARYPFLYLVRGHIFKFLLYRLLIPAADHVFVQSEQMRRDIASAKACQLDKMTAVPMGIDADKFRSARAMNGSDRSSTAGTPAFCIWAHLGKVRRLEFMIRVLARSGAVIPEAMLYFVGKGDEPDDEALLIREAQRLEVEDASETAYGQMPQDQALRYVQEADVCVSPFFPTPILNSTSPTKLVEYMAMGKAVVANDHPGTAPGA